MKNVIRKITTWMLVFGMTFTPVLTSIDTVMANAGEEKITITVDGENKDFNKGNLTNETVSKVNVASEANTAANQATTAANEAATAAADAAAAAASAKTAAVNAEKALTNAANAAADAALTNNNVASLVQTVENAGTYTDVQEKITEANTAIQTAETAESNANTAVGNANTAIDNWNNQVDIANAKIDEANDSKLGNSDKNITGTEALIQAAADYLKDTVKTAETDTNTYINTNLSQDAFSDVQGAIDAADTAYAGADTNAQKALNNINTTLADALKGLYSKEGAYIADDVTNAASDAKGYAEGYEKDAKKAADNAEGYYGQIKSMVDNDAFDPDLAASLVSLTQNEATKAETAARNAAAQAAAAKVAEELAETNLINAENAVNDARVALEKARNAYNTSRAAAAGPADTADSMISAINTKVDTANGMIGDLESKADTYNGYTDKDGNEVKGYVQKANDSIVETNRLIGLAQDEIDNLQIGKSEGLEFEKDSKIAEANAALKVLKDDENNVDLQKAATGAVKAASDAVEAAKKALKEAQDALDQAKTDYDAAEIQSAEATQYAADAQTALESIIGKDGNGGYLKKVQDKAALAETLTKDTVSLVLNGETVDELNGRVSKADQELKKAQSEAQRLADAFPGFKAGKEEEIRTQEGYKTQYQGEIDSIEADSAYVSAKGYVETRNKRIDGETYSFDICTSSLRKEMRTFNSEIDRLRWVAGNPKKVDFWGKEKGAYFEDSVVKDAQKKVKEYDAQNRIYTAKNGEIDGWQEKIKKIDEETIPGIQAKIDEEKRKVEDAQGVVTAKQGIYDTVNTEVTGKLSAVDNFVASNDNTLVLDLEGLDEERLNAKLAEIAAILSGKGSVEANDEYKKAQKSLKDDYGPQKGDWHDDRTYVTVDKDTTDYASHVGPDVWPFTSLDDLVEEEMIEYKYRQWYQAIIAINDEGNYKALIKETNDKCVIVCNDINKLSEIRALFANEKAQQALNEANVAAAAAQAAQARAAAAKANEKEAKKKFDDAQKVLDEASKILNGDGQAVPGLSAPTYTPAEIATLKDVKELKDLEDPYNTDKEDPNNDYVESYDKASIPALLTKVNEYVRPENRSAVFDLLLSYLPSKNDGEWEYPEEQDAPLSDQLSTLGVELNADEQGLVLTLLETFQNATKKLSDAVEAYDSAKEDHRLAEEAAERAAGHAKRARYFANAAAALTYANTPGGTGESGSTPTPGTPASSGPVLIPLTGGTTPSGVAGVRVAAAGEGEGTGEGTAPADNTVAKNNASTIEETELPGAAEAPSTNLKDTDLPGAQGATDNDANLWWLWAAIAVLLALGFGTYKYVDNKKKAENTIQK